MNFPVSKLVTCGLLFLLTLASGVWLTHSGKPYNGVLFNLHKLIALAAVVIIGINVFHLYRAMDPKTIIVLTVIAAAGLMFLALFITGALLSIGQPGTEAIFRVHQIAPLLALGALAAGIYLLVAAQP